MAKSLGKSVFTFQEIFSPWHRVFYFFVAVFWASPLLVLDLVPPTPRWMLVVLVFTFLPFFLWYSFGRRIIQICPAEQVVKIHYGIVKPIFTRTLPLNSFERVDIRARHDTVYSDVVTSSDVPHRPIKPSTKVTLQLRLVGQRSLVAYEMGFSETDEAFAEEARAHMCELKRQVEAFL
ncbi:hypothetical protein [Microbulbifer yueqingensis]|uniref:Uncharacterized protein n=1 Tax=Microbulbifer yueqingensis TaxID=658219 RepID=A0A1G9EK06_9GAMM|nr:hypothetical protein [Microbulbifer yueqingensis]SDK76361.1 hypothetical protein SAMN05216212_3160 [Microbulbifer yueqingensis]